MFQQVLTFLFHEFSRHIVQLFQFQLYFHFLMYYFHQVFNHHYCALLCCIYYEFAAQVFVDFLGIEYHQH